MNEGSVDSSYSTADVFGYDGYSGGLVSYNKGVIQASYSTGYVSGRNAGGLVGRNDSTIVNSWSNGRVVYSNATTSFLGGLVGRDTLNGVVEQSYWGIENSGRSVGLGHHKSVLVSTFTGLSKSALRQVASFGSWDFVNTWKIVEGKSAPALRKVSDNAPFAFGDTLGATTYLSLSSSSRMFQNDYDVETATANLIWKVDSVSVGSVSSGIWTMPQGFANGDTARVYYRAGEVRSSDTLWSGQAVGVVYYGPDGEGTDASPFLIQDTTHLKLVGSNTGCSMPLASTYHSSVLNAAGTKQTAYTFNFTGDWGIVSDKSYPALKAFNNMPFGLADTLGAKAQLPLVRLQTNDYDFESGTALVWRIDSVSAGTLSQDKDTLYLPGDFAEGALVHVYYSVGELSGLDTLWGSPVVSVVYYGPDGEGTDASPYLVSDYAQLKQVGKGFYGLDKVYQLSADIDASASNFTPIGTEAARFTGKFLGAGHVIRNLTIHLPSTDNVGLFGYTNEATIDSLGLVQANVTGRDHVGSFIGVQNGGTLSKVYSNGIVTGRYNVGNIAGTNNGNIANVYSLGQVNGEENVGGLVGTQGSNTLNAAYSAGRVFSTGTSYGGLVGSATNDPTYAVYDVQVLGAIAGNGNLSTTDLKKQSSFSNWDFVGTWSIQGGSSYPGLQGIDNAPFAFADSFAVNAGLPLARLAENDYDLETGVSKLVVRIDTLWRGDAVEAFTGSSLNLGVGDSLTVLYTVGEDRTTDTLWGGQARSIVVYGLKGSGTVADPFMVERYKDLKLVGKGNYGLSKVYRLANDIDATESSVDNCDLQGQNCQGFAPIGSGKISAFSGKFQGAGYMIRNLAIARATQDNIGLFGYLSGTVDSLGLLAASVAGKDSVGALAGVNAGSISHCFAMGQVSGTNVVGGLVGITRGKIQNGYSTVTTIGSSGYVGGLTGYLTGGATASITNSFSNGSLVSMSSIKGGLVGQKDAGTGVLNSYYDKDIAGFTAGEGVALTTAKTKMATEMSGFEYAGVWRIYEGNTTPLLRAFLKPLVITAADSVRAYDGKIFSAPRIAYGLPKVDAAQIKGGSPVIGGTAPGAKDVGEYTIVINGSALCSTQQGYDLSFVNGKLTIAKAPLTITASDVTLTVGAKAPKAYLFTYAGFVKGENESVLTVLPTATSSCASSNKAGKCDIVPSGASATNYAIAYVKGTLTLNAPVSIATRKLPQLQLGNVRHWDLLGRTEK